VIPSGRERRERPSYRELSGKLGEALRLVETSRWLPASADKLQANWDELEEECGIETALSEDQAAILTAALREITPNHYVGRRPPEPSYEPAARGQELFAFRWQSRYFGNREMYFKFSMSRGGEGRVFIHSVHPNRPIQSA
jgi:hypothetical protein